MPRFSRLFVFALVQLMFFQAVTPVGLGDEPFSGLFKAVGWVTRNSKERTIERARPAMCQHPSIETLAGQIDWLEHHLEMYGSVVPKQPDIWGEARLTKHRNDVERELSKRLSAFGPNLQASLRRSDQSALALALALGTATSAGGSTSTNPAIGMVSVGPAEEKPSIERSIQLAGTSGVFNGTSGNSLAIGIEPVLHNNQLNRYLNALNQLRRINEGDDTTDSPGYALNLVRIPVSVLPGKRTREGYGAEISFTAAPILGDDLLPATFRSLVINGLVQQHALAMVRVIEANPSDPTEKLRIRRRAEDEVESLRTPLRGLRDRIEQFAFQSIDPEVQARAERYVSFFDQHFAYLLKRFVEIETLVRSGLGSESITVGESEFDVDDKPYQFRMDLTAAAMADAVRSLLIKRFASLTVRCTVTMPDKTSVDAEFAVLVIEKDGLSGLKPGDVPYSFYAPFSGNLKDLLSKGTASKTPSGAGKPEAVGKLIREIDQITFASTADDIASQIGQTIESAAKKNREEVRAWINQVGPKDSTTFSFAHVREILQNASPVEFLIDESDLVSARDTFDTAVTSVEQVLGLLSQGWNARDDGDAKKNPPNGKAAPVPNSTTSSVQIRSAGMPSWAYQGQASEFADQQRARGSLAEAILDSAFVQSRDVETSSPIAPSIYFDVHGAEVLEAMVRETDRLLNRMPRNQGPIRMLVDARRGLSEELSAAYDMLSMPEQQHLWSFAGPQLADAIHSKNITAVASIRRSYLSSLTGDQRLRVSGALGWCILLEASLVNRKLHRDMRRLASEKRCDCVPDATTAFYDVDPTLDARDQFNRYVMCRWPVKVFALDPSTQDQNVADSFSGRRELQLAAAIAVAGGANPQNLAGQFARRLEVDIQALALNRTIVGYSHANDTFGWRFYPRVQTPSTPSTLGAIGETLFGGASRDRSVRQRQIDPGVRECTALVVMPSFVPFIQFSSRADWFRLNRPADKELTMKDTMRLSSAYQSVSNFANCATDCGCYRAGDVGHLRRVIDHLDRRLPLQATKVQVPFENNNSGYELFRAGVAALGPQINGWFGAPGIDPLKPTTFFLQGRNFSIQSTTVVVGGVEADTELVSRDLLKIRVPASTRPLGYGNYPNGVEVQLATPYGAQHFTLPQILSLPEKNAPLRWATQVRSVQATIDVEQAGTDAEKRSVVINPATDAPLQIETPLPVISSKDTLKVTFYSQAHSRVRSVGGENDYAILLSADKKKYVTKPTESAKLDKIVADYLLTLKSSLPIGTPYLHMMIQAKASIGGQVIPVGGIVPVEIHLTWK